MDQLQLNNAILQNQCIPNATANDISDPLRMPGYAILRQSLCNNSLLIDNNSMINTIFDPSNNPVMINNLASSKMLSAATQNGGLNCISGVNDKGGDISGGGIGVIGEVGSMGGMVDMSGMGGIGGVGGIGAMGGIGGVAGLIGLGGVGGMGANLMSMSEAQRMANIESLRTQLMSTLPANCPVNEKLHNTPRSSIHQGNASSRNSVPNAHVKNTKLFVDYKPQTSNEDLPTVNDSYVDI